MKDFIVQKKGKTTQDQWSDRILSIDGAEQALYLSRKQHRHRRFTSGDATPHRMERVHRFEFWPSYPKRVVDSGLSGELAKLTFCVTGLVHHRYSMRRRLLPSSLCTVVTEPQMAAGDVRPHKFIRLQEIWVLRCGTPKDLVLLLSSMRQAFSPFVPLEGFEFLSSHLKPPAIAEVLEEEASQPTADRKVAPD